ncbi:MAG: GTP-binding protein [Hyphomicrobiaceae bacterium]
MTASASRRKATPTAVASALAFSPAEFADGGTASGAPVTLLNPKPTPVGRAENVRSTVEAAPVARSASSARELNGILRLLTCGSVDDGKSTLIGRLLFDASDLYDDQRATIERSRLAGTSGLPDFSLLVDGLAAEREQGITIDIAWRYFDTERRRFVVIDSPGHEQYTRNMASGASHADVAIMLVDARTGIKKQTLRHAAILDLMGVRRVVLAVNKMDLVGFAQEQYAAISADFAKLTTRFGFTEAIAIPVAAVTGDNIARQSDAMAWYTGPTLLAYLDGLPSRITHAGGQFRMPVQTVLRDGLDFRGLAGTVAAGSVCVGDRIVDVLSGRSSRVQRIATMGGDLEVARTGQAVAIQLENDLDISRGAVLSGAGPEPVAANALDVKFVWLAEDGFDPKASYLLRTATDLVPVSKLRINALLDLETLQTSPASRCVMNDIALAEIDLGRPVAVDAFNEHAETGSFMIVNTLTGASVAGGVILAARAAESPIAVSATGFVVTRATLAAGLCSDLDESAAGRAEFERRTLELVKLFGAAGAAVSFDI